MQPTNHKIFIIVIILITLAIAWVLYISVPRAKPPADSPLIDEEKQVILDNLNSAPAPQITQEQKQQIIKDLSQVTPKPLTEEEKRKILESLQQ